MSRRRFRARPAPLGCLDDAVHGPVTDDGWLDLSLLAFAEGGLGHSVIGGYDRGAFVLMLAVGCVFEAAWQIKRGTNAMT